MHVVQCDGRDNITLFWLCSGILVHTCNVFLPFVFSFAFAFACALRVCAFFPQLLLIVWLLFAIPFHNIFIYRRIRSPDSISLVFLAQCRFHIGLRYIFIPQRVHGQWLSVYQIEPKPQHVNLISRKGNLYLYIFSSVSLFSIDWNIWAFLRVRAFVSFRLQLEFLKKNAS